MSSSEITIKRYMFMGYYQSRDIEVKDNDHYISYAFFKDMVFLYFEAINYEKAEDIIRDYVKIDMKQFPTGEEWVQMMDIFHYSHPVNKETAEFRIAILKPEKVSEYIYYHFQGQQTFNYKYGKYGAIYLYRNMLIMYDEFPLEDAEYHLVPGQWTKEDLVKDYDGDIITDLSEIWHDIDRNGWRECE